MGANDTATHAGTECNIKLRSTDQGKPAVVALLDLGVPGVEQHPLPWQTIFIQTL